MTAVIARDRTHQMVLLGGFGWTGCGTMWLPEDDYMHTFPVWRRITRPGVIGFEPTDLTFDTAPELSYDGPAPEHPSWAVCDWCGAAIFPDFERNFHDRHGDFSCPALDGPRIHEPRTERAVP